VRLCGPAACGLLVAAAACASAPTTGDSSGGRTEEVVASRDQPGGRPAQGVAAVGPLDDARAVHGTIDPATGRRTAQPAVNERLHEPVRTEIQSGRLRQADEPYHADAGNLPTGFRVQVMATPDFGIAGGVASRLKGLLGGRFPVYVEYIDPYYKVRVGDFATQEAAQPALGEVRALGYRDAWAVRTTIKQARP
jgi:SPOR domain